MATAGKKVKLKATSSAVAFVDEACSTSDNTTYQITDIAKRIWSPTATITVKDSAVPTVESFTINRLKGTITFGSASARTITVSGDYLPSADILEAFDYSLDLSANNEQDSAFGDEWITREQTLKDVTGSFSQWRLVDNTMFDHLVNADQLVIEIFDDNTNPDPFLRLWCRLATDSLSASVDSLIEEAIDFEGTTDSDGRAVTTF